MARDTARLVPSKEVPEQISTDPIRDALSEKHQRVDLDRPEALDLAARLHGALHRRLTGSASQLRISHSSDWIRQALRGERNISLVDLAELAKLPTTETRQAIYDVAVILAGEVGQRLEPIDAVTESAHQVLAGIATAAGALQGEMAQALEDNNLDPAEAAGMREEVKAVKAEVAKAEALFEKAEARGRR